MQMKSYECPVCGYRENVLQGDVVECDSHGRPLCRKDGMPMLPITLVPSAREERGAAVHPHM